MEKKPTCPNCGSDNIRYFTATISADISAFKSMGCKDCDNKFSEIDMREKNDPENN